MNQRIIEKLKNPDPFHRIINDGKRKVFVDQFTSLERMQFIRLLQDNKNRTDVERMDAQGGCPRQKTGDKKWPLK